MAVALAETATYSARVGEELRTSTVEVVRIDNLPSVSVKRLVADFGGQVKVSGNSVQVTLQSASATLTLGDTEVIAASRFTIQRPPRVYENDIYIDPGDVAPFLTYAFKLDVRTGAATTTADPAAAPTVPSGRKLRVVLDAGHGGTDAGAAGQLGMPEKTITRAIAEKVGKLIASGCDASYTRSEDRQIPTSERVGKANVELKGDLLVSIHVGASASKTASGFEFFCPMGSGDPLSSRSLGLARSMSNAMAESTGLAPRGVRQAPCRIFTNLQVPGVLVEVGCITNATEEALLADPGHQDKLAQGIANGILAYAGAKAQ
ncbi:MAG: N-acetylmuramoyl-L-alanine amidase [Candidatus Hydrogenedentes bacterium]|nr:N-acetylmuramoyl-L-alanine amidase [Candidatus Hydrogenedentota bacterium]